MGITCSSDEKFSLHGFCAACCRGHGQGNMNDGTNDYDWRFSLGRGAMNGMVTTGWAYWGLKSSGSDG